MKLRLQQFAFLLIAALLASSCVPAAPVAPAPTAPIAAATAETGGTLVRAMTSEPAQIDPQGAPSSGLSLVLPYLFDTLVTRDVDNRLVPLLAESWEVAPDGKAITMRLKAGVVFHDGTPLNAEAVRFTFERFQKSGSKSPIYGGIQQIASVEAVDDLTVRFTFAEPAANFWSTITMPYAGIISPQSAQQVDASGEGHLVGSGPLRLGEWLAGQSLTLERNPAYAWGSPLTENRGAPYIERLVFKVLPDAATQLAALKAGEVDVIFINQPDHRRQLENDPDIRLEETVLNSLIYLGFNCAKPPFDDARVRRALAHAVDKQAIVDLALGGLGVVAFAPLPPTLLGFDPSLKEQELGYDPQQATALLQEAGFTQVNGGWQRDGQTLGGVLLTSNRPPNDAIAALLQSQLKAIGVPVEIQQLDSKAVMQAANEGTFDLLLWRYDWNDPDALNIFLGSDRIGSTNRVAYSNPEVDQLLAQGARTLDETERQRIYVAAQRFILEDAPWQPLYNPIDVMAISRRVEGIKIGYMGRMLINDVRVAAR